MRPLEERDETGFEIELSVAVAELVVASDRVVLCSFRDFDDDDCTADEGLLDCDLDLDKDCERCDEVGTTIELDVGIDLLDWPPELALELEMPRVED